MLGSVAGGTIRGMNSPSRFRISASTARWCVVGLVLAALLAGSLLPGGVQVLPERAISLPGGFVIFLGGISPPVKHLIAFGLLGFFLVLALEADWRRAGLVAGGLAGLGLAIELVQIVIPIRSFLWLDAGASAAGAVGGVVIGLFVRWFVGGAADETQASRADVARRR